MATPNNENPICRDVIDHQNEIQREMDMMILTVFQIKEAVRGRREHSTLVRVRELHSKATDFLKEVKAEKNAGLLDSCMVKLEALDEDAVISLAAIPHIQPTEQLAAADPRQAICLQTVKSAETLPSALASAALPPTSATSGSGSTTSISVPKAAASIPTPARPKAEEEIKQSVQLKKVVQAAAAPLKPLTTPWREGNSKQIMYATIFDYPEKPHLPRNDRDQVIKREMEERQMNANSTLLSKILAKKRSTRTWDMEDLIVWDPKVSKTKKIFGAFDKAIYWRALIKYLVESGEVGADEISKWVPPKQWEALQTWYVWVTCGKIAYSGDPYDKKRAVKMGEFLGAKKDYIEAISAAEARPKRAEDEENHQLKVRGRHWTQLPPRGDRPSHRRV